MAPDKKVERLDYRMVIANRISDKIVIFSPGQVLVHITPSKCVNFVNIGGLTHGNARISIILDESNNLLLNG